MNASPIKCLLTRKFWQQDLEYLRMRVTPAIEFIIPKEYTSGALVEASGHADILMGDVPSVQVLDAGKKVELLQIPWTGVDQVDFDLLKKYSFVVCNSHSNAQSVAELGIALLLSCLKQIPSHHEALRQGNWRRPGASDCVMPEILSGKKVGVIGYGAVGRKLVQMLCGFGVKLYVLASSGRRDGEIEVLGPDSLDSLCRDCDILIIAVALTPSTLGMLGKQQFLNMKRNAYVINIARGAVVDEEALYEALKSNLIAGAGIDGWYQYPQRGKSQSPVSRFPFEELNNVVMSPHRGGMVRGELPHLVDAIENLNRFAAGKPLINRVDLNKGY